MKTLRTLVRLHRWRLDERRRDLADLERMADRIADDIATAEAELAAQRETATVAQAAAGAGDPGHLGAWAFPGYLVAALERRRRQEATRADIVRRIETARDEVAAGFQELKRHELTLAERERVARAEDERLEQAALDEGAIDRQRRRNA